MDPITLIVTAPAAGAVLAVKDIASAAVKDASTDLKGLMRERLGGPDAELVLTKHEKAPRALASCSLLEEVGDEHPRWI